MVVTGSIMTKVPLPTFSSYAAAKHALLGFVNSLRIELSAERSPVTISLVHPAGVDTPLWDHTSTAGGTLPRRPPDLYKPEVIADALVACAVRPRHDVHVGSEATIVVAGLDAGTPGGRAGAHARAPALLVGPRARPTGAARCGRASAPARPRGPAAAARASRRPCAWP